LHKLKKEGEERMKAKPWNKLTILFAVIMVNFFSAPSSWATLYETINISNNSYTDTLPAMNDHGQVVWMGLDVIDMDWEIL